MTVPVPRQGVHCRRSLSDAGEVSLVAIAWTIPWQFHGLRLEVDFRPHRIAHHLDRGWTAGECLKAERSLADEQRQPVDDGHPMLPRGLDEPRLGFCVHEIDHA